MIGEIKDLRKVRTLDILFGVAAVALVVALSFDVLSTAATWAVLVLLAVYIGSTARWRSPYRKPDAGLHLDAK